jgi:hypothetical protein
MFTISNVSYNLLAIKPLRERRKEQLIQDVDFLQHMVLIHIRVVFCKVEAERKDNATDLSERLLVGMYKGFKPERIFRTLRYEFCDS